MKFDNLCNLILKEADEIEDTNELTEDQPPMDVINSEPITREDKIQYLTRILPDIAEKNRNKTPAQLAARAEWILDNDLYDVVRSAHEENVAAQAELSAQDDEIGALEELPPELDNPNPSEEDIPDVPAISEFERERKDAAIAREEEDEILPGEELGPSPLETEEEKIARRMPKRSR